MKKTILSAGLALFTSALMAQATLPSTENFTGFTGTFSQAGWTYVDAAGGTAPNYVYATGGVGGSTAGRLDETMDYIQVFVGGQMGTTTYVLKGNNTGGGWLGTFKVRESVDGNTWTDLASYVDGALTSTLTTFTVTPAAASRYIRWEFTSKTSGNNIAIDDINITAGVSANSDINVKYATTPILSGGTTPIFNSAVGTAVPVNFTIENLGLANLDVTSASISGAAAADYSITSPAGAFSVNPQSNATLTLSFNPSATGTRDAVLTINSNDADESAYVINLYGVGGNLVSEPASQPSNLNFSSIKSYRAKFSFTASTSNPNAYIILRQEGNSIITDIPVDGIPYKKGDRIGNSKVEYVGSSVQNTMFNIWAGKTYQLAVFSFNGSGTFINYNTNSPATGNFTSLSTMMPANEYSSVSTSAATFITDLHNKVNPHSSIFYSNYANTMINLFESRDTSDGRKYVVCSYSSYRAVYTPPFDWTSNDFSREHSFPHTWMPTFPADNPEKPEYNDQHMLYPTKQNDVNAERSNYPLGEVITVQSAFLDGKVGLNAIGKKVYEPRDEHKGNAARAIMYQSICYTGVSGNLWNFPNPISATVQYGQDQEVLKAWHYQDPPDAYEIARNDFLDSLQGNRNPFIDSVQYACYIDFYTMTKIQSASTPCGSFVGLNNSTLNVVEFNLFPNPSTGKFNYSITAENGNYDLRILDVSGRSVYQKQIESKSGMLYGAINDVKLNSGIYFIELISEKGKWVKKLVIQE
jgi:hypothetical protein